MAREFRIGWISTGTTASMTGHCGSGWPGSISSGARLRTLIMANKKIGILFGMEDTFPPALVEKINSMKTAGVTAEFVKIGGIRMDEPQKYDVIPYTTSYR